MCIHSQVIIFPGSAERREAGLCGGLLDEAKHLGNLTFRVWEKMREDIKFTPVILDPNTAARDLHLSEDLTSVTRKKSQDHPDNPEKFTKYANVLGSEGFSSGKHEWEVEVGDHPRWQIGVAKESLERKVKYSQESGSGYWCLFHHSDEYTNSFGKLLTLKKIPQRIRVVLDYDRGEVSFSNPHSNEHIYTHKDTFSEKIYPYFNIGSAGEAQTKDVKVCDQKVMWWGSNGSNVYQVSLQEGKAGEGLAVRYCGVFQQRRESFYCNNTALILYIWEWKVHQRPQLLLSNL